MPKAYSYVRFSSEMQRGNNSEQRQLAMAQKYVDQTKDTLGLELQDVSFKDLGMSAYKGANAEVGKLAEFLEAVRAGHIEKGSYLLVEALDRISRLVPRKAIRVFEDILEAGIVVVTLNDQQVWSAERLDKDTLSFAMSVLYFIQANRESAEKGRRVAASRAASRAKIPEGKQITKIVPFWIMSEDKNQVIPEKVAIVRRIWGLALEGYGVRAITEVLNRESIPSPKGAAKWSFGTVDKILTEKKVLGTLVSAKEVFEGYYPAVVSEEEYATVAASRKVARNANSSPAEGKKHPLAGLVVCSKCGSGGNKVKSSAVVNKSGKKKTYNKIYCGGAINKNGICRHIGIDYTKTLKAIAEGLKLFQWGEEGDTGLDGASGYFDAKMDEVIEDIQDLQEMLRKDRNNSVIREQLAERFKELEAIKVEEQQYFDSHTPISEKIALKAIEAVSNADYDQIRLVLKQVTIDFEGRKLELVAKNGNSRTVDAPAKGAGGKR